VLLCTRFEILLYLAQRRMYSILAGMRLAGNEWLALSWLSAERLCYLRCRNVAEFVLGFEYVHKRSINFATPSYRKFEIIQLQ